MKKYYNLLLAVLMTASLSVVEAIPSNTPIEITASKKKKVKNKTKNKKKKVTEKDDYQLYTFERNGELISVEFPSNIMMDIEDSGCIGTDYTDDTVYSLCISENTISDSFENNAVDLFDEYYVEDENYVEMVGKGSVNNLHYVEYSNTKASNLHSRVYTTKGGNRFLLTISFSLRMTELSLLAAKKTKFFESVSVI